MKQSVLSIVFATLVTLHAKSQDINPVANLQTLPVGTYVIAMDNTLQANGSNKFNLYSYGLIVHLLNYHINIKWVMRTNKAKDDVDFTAMAQQIQPSLVATSSSLGFKAAPFVIYPADTTGVSSLINSFYISQGLTGNDRPRVYRTTIATPNVDIRYNMANFIPRAAILTDGGNEKIHRDYMIAAGITTNNYKEVASITLSDCYTFASEPHNSKNGPEVDSAISSIKNFVLSGRNFLAECAAIKTYENSPLGRFQTTGGVDDVNENINNNLAYPYADLSYYQFDGTYNANSGGSVKNWKIIGTPSHPAAYTHVTGTGVNTEVQAATFTKVVSGPGGMVYYLGNHSFSENSQEGINGIRMYLNAFLTPTNPAAANGCFGGGQPLAVKLVSFQGNLFNNRVSLQWTVGQNEMSDNFEVERSTNGIEFSTASLVFATEKAGTEYYQYAEAATAAKLFYRLKMTDKSRVVTYSKILVFQNNSITDNDIKIIGNPVKDILTLSFQSNNNQVVTINVNDMTGRQVMQQTMNSYKGNNLATLSIPVTLNKGMYLVDLYDGATHRAVKFVKN
jgi:hypothetical protein